MAVLLTHQVVAVKSLDEVDFEQIDAIINLAGEPIVNKRWSDSQKRELLDSRIKLTQQITKKSTAAIHHHTLLFLAVRLAFMVDKAIAK